MKNSCKKWCLLSVLTFMIGGCLTGCYPDGKQLEDAKTDENSIIVDKNTSTVQSELDEGLVVNAKIDVQTDLDWKINNVTLKRWDMDNACEVFGAGRKIIENKTLPNMHNENLSDNYIYWDDGSMLVLQWGDLKYYSKKELDYSYLSYLYGTMPYLTEEANEKFPETEISGVSKEDAIKSIKDILEKVGIEVSEPKVYSLTYEKLEENTDYSQIDPDGNTPHKWQEEDEAYAIAFRGTLNTLPITEVGYRSGPAAGERIVGIVGRQGLISLQALNIFDPEAETVLSEECLNVETILKNVKNKFRNVMITGDIEIEKISLEYVPTLENVEAGEYTLKPMYVCMARQDVQHTQDKKGENLLEESSIFPIIFDAQSGVEIQIGGTY